MKRDAVIRRFILGQSGSQSWIANPENCIMRRLLMRPTDIPEPWESYSSKYPYVFDFEWSIMINGSLHYGDLLFTDGANNFLCVETKSVEPTAFAATPQNKQTLHTKRHKSKKSALDQTAKYVRALHDSAPYVTCTEGVVVTERTVQRVLKLDRTMV